MQITYEEHIDKLRAQVDRIMSRGVFSTWTNSSFNALLPGENVGSRRRPKCIAVRRSGSPRPLRDQAMA
jgi:hypothetical protein